MFQTAGHLKGVTIEAMDGDIGSLQDLYFDDHTWTVRYLVVDTGTWLPGRQVLISPFAFQPVPGASRLRTSLTKEQVRDSPSVDSDRPVDRQREIAFSQYYGYPYYWDGPYRWGELAYPVLPAAPQPSAVEREIEEQIVREYESADPHLRSARDVMGYYIHATDGDIGHVEDFLLDDESWAIRYIVVDTRNWLPGRKVLVSPEWIRNVSWEESKVHVDLSKRHIEAAPEFDPSVPLAREHEERLYTHHGRAKYWEREPRASEGKRNGKN
jgi:uncharacterized protein YrrD